MSRQNVELAQRIYQQFAKTRTIAPEAVGPDIEFHDHDAVHGLRVYRGLSELGRLLADNADGFDDFSVEADSFQDAGDHVIVRVRLSGIAQTTGLAVARSVFHVLTIKGGKLVLWRGYPTRAEALEAVGLRE